MPATVEMAFDPAGIVVPVAQILPMRAIRPETKSSPQYRRLTASVREIGLIEPLIVHPQSQRSGAAGRYILLDGHSRLEVLKELRVDRVFCLVALDDEGFSYNHKVNQVPPIQEHFMIMKALENGVGEDRIAATLNVDVKMVRQKRDLLSGLCPEAVTLLKDRHVSAAALRELKRATPMRQIEMAELMLAANNFSLTYARCLVVATPADQLLPAEREREAAGMRPEDAARMEHEMEILSREFRLVEDSYGRNTMHLILAVGYVRKLLDNAKVVRQLTDRHADILGELRKLADAAECRGG